MHKFDALRPLDEQIAWLGKQDPHYLLTYPTNLLAILKRCEESGLRLLRLRGVTTLGEVVDPEVREACVRVCGFPLSDGYSAQELGGIALQCPDHVHYHVQSESVLVEVLDDDGNPCRPGEVGRIVVTDLHNFAMPLIRYEVGDYAEVGRPCPCGRGLPVLARIMGRTRNMLMLPGGTQVWPRFGLPRFPDIAPVRQAQIVQKTLDTLEVRLVVVRPLAADEERRLKELICEAVGVRFDVVFSYFDEIPRNPNGKYEDFRCEVTAE
jgi:phenylacetate-CoA ligase